MTTICYTPKDFRAASLAIIDQANQIIGDYERQGFSLTLRQLYYQFVARDLIPNTERSYKRLGSIINDARMAGLVSWSAIEDRTRNLTAWRHYDDPEDAFEQALERYDIDHWAGQHARVEVWIEKEALVGILHETCGEWDVPYFACRGYVSQSEQFAAGQRIIRRLRDEGQQTIVLHLGDHDPSGIDMTRDNLERLRTFTERYGCPFEVRRLALNMDQIDEYGPPPNPAKVTDSRFDSYLSNYGSESWELDALEPQVITQLIEDEINSIVNHDLWAQADDRLRNDKVAMRAAIANLKERL